MLRNATAVAATSWTRTVRRPSSVLLRYQSRCSSSSYTNSNAVGELPHLSSARQYMSLYNYTPLPESELPRLRRQMLAVWKRMDVLGRIYISQEGVNAQLTVPTANVSAFTTSFPDLFEHKQIFFGELLQPTHSGSGVDDCSNGTITYTNKQHVHAPFDKLDIRIRDQIVRDGFAKGHLDLQNAGASLSPAQWHARLQERNARNDATTLVLDVRNFYEHEIGRFDGATRIMVDTFRDTFDAVDEILATHEATHDGAKPREVMMYCTGGIRCEKVGAYLAQYKGITNVQKLHGGIVNYMRFLKESDAAVDSDASDRDSATNDDGVAAATIITRKPERMQSLFRGKNFVFDQRCVAKAQGDGSGALHHAAEEVTPDVLGECFQCGAPCNQHTNCANLMCGGLILQCLHCAMQSHGACSDACKAEVLTMRALSPDARKHYRKRHADKWMPPVPNALSHSNRHMRIRPVPTILRTQQQRFCTASRYVGPLTESSSNNSSGKCSDDEESTSERVRLNAYVDIMSSVHSDEALLTELRAATVREWPKSIQLIDAPQGKLLRFLIELLGATRVLEIGCFTGYSALCMANGLALRQPNDDSDTRSATLLTCDVDADTMAFAQQFFARSSRSSQIHSVVSDGMALLDALAPSDTSAPPSEQFDLIFVDANKKQYTAYYEAVLAKQLLRQGGLLVFDNTLFRGRVLASASGVASPKERIAHSLARFNAHVAADPRTTQVLLPLWDGLTIVRETSAPSTTPHTAD